jgi:hypothetical protein
MQNYVQGKPGEESMVEIGVLRLKRARRSTNRCFAQFLGKWKGRVAQ